MWIDRKAVSGNTIACKIDHTLSKNGLSICASFILVLIKCICNLTAYIWTQQSNLSCKKKHLRQQFNRKLCAYLNVCIHVFCVAVLGACSASPSAHGLRIISSEHATAAGFLYVHCVCWSSGVFLSTHCGVNLNLSSTSLAKAIGGVMWMSVNGLCCYLRGTAVRWEITHCHTHPCNCR